MNLKLNLLILLIGLATGAGAVYKLTPQPKPVYVTDTVTKLKTIKVTETSGKVTETTEQVSSVNQEPQKIELKKYGVGIFHDKSIFAEARLGALPLFLIGSTNFNEYKIGLKLEF